MAVLCRLGTGHQKVYDIISLPYADGVDGMHVKGASWCYSLEYSDAIIGGAEG